MCFSWPHEVSLTQGSQNNHLIKLSPAWLICLQFAFAVSTIQHRDELSQQRARALQNNNNNRLGYSQKKMCHTWSNQSRTVVLSKQDVGASLGTEISSALLTSPKAHCTQRKLNLLAHCDKRDSMLLRVIRVSGRWD